MAADVAEMETMVAHLLQRERLREGRALRREPHDLAALVREAVERGAGRPPGVRVARAPGRLIVPLDPDGARTVLRNLIDNALKYSSEGSRAVEVSIEADAAGALVRIADDGPGFADADLDRIFEPFYRGDPSRSRRTGGYGLGLSICRDIMEAHGGTIAVERGVPRGATIVLRWPGAG
jgi:signal transduction histidine kinase